MAFPAPLNRVVLAEVFAGKEVGVKLAVLSETFKVTRRQAVRIGR